MLAAIEGIDAVLIVDTDGGDLFERPAIRQFRPVFDDAVFEVATANDVRHFRPPDLHSVAATNELLRRRGEVTEVSDVTQSSRSARATPSLIAPIIKLPD